MSEVMDGAVGPGFRGPALFKAIYQGTAVAGVGRGPWIVVLPFLIDLAQLEALLQLPGVAGVMLPGVLADKRFGAAVGLLPEAGDWTLPKVDAGGLLLLANPAGLAIAWWRSALRAGLRQCLFMSSAGLWEVRSTHGEFLRQLFLRALRCRPQLGLGDKGERLEKCLSQLGTSWASSAGKLGASGVLHVNASLGAGGAERQLVRLCNAQADRGIPVSLLISGRGQVEDAFFGDDLKREIDWRFLPSFPELIGSLDADGRSRWALRRERGAEKFLADLPAGFAELVRRFLVFFLIARPVVVHLWQDETNVAGGLGALLAGVPRIVLAQRNLAPWRFGYYSAVLRPLYRFLASQDGVVMLNNTQAGADDYAKWLGLPPGRILTIPNAVDSKLDFPAPEALAAWRAQHDLASGPVVGGVFRLMDEKDPLLWLATVALVARQLPTVRFLLVGDGPRRQLVADEISRLELERKICCLPAEKDVSLPLAAMDVFLLTSRAEGMPNVLMEAGLLGCPVVTTDVGGCAEVVDHGINGWLVSERRAEQLAEKVLAVLGDATGRERIRREAPSLICSKFSMEQVLAQTLAVYVPDDQVMPGASDGTINRWETS